MRREWNRFWERAWDAAAAGGRGWVGMGTEQARHSLAHWEDHPARGQQMQNVTADADGRPDERMRRGKAATTRRQLSLMERGHHPFAPAPADACARPTWPQRISLSMTFVLHSTNTDEN